MRMDAGIPDDAAFPCEGNQRYGYGMSYRAYFAGLAMQGLIASQGNNSAGFHAGSIAGLSVLFADSLIEELNR